MQIVPVIYHRDTEAWWADSPAIDGWTATAETLDELRQLIEDGVRFALDSDDDVVIEHMLSYGVSDQAAVIFDFVAEQTTMHPEVVGRLSDRGAATLTVATG